MIDSYGNIPTVSELNHLTGHTSYSPCRFCTIRPFKVGHLGKASNQPNDLCRQRTIEDYKKGDVKHGIKKKSCFRKLKAFASVMFLGLDIFRLFNVNIAKQIKGFITRKGSVLELKPRYQAAISLIISEQAPSLPFIFRVEFKDFFSPKQRLRGMDWAMFLQYLLPTFVVERLYV